MMKEQRHPMEVDGVDRRIADRRSGVIRDGVEGRRAGEYEDYHFCAECGCSFVFSDYGCDACGSADEDVHSDAIHDQEGCGF